MPTQELVDTVLRFINRPAAEHATGTRLNFLIGPRQNLGCAYLLTKGALRWQLQRPDRSVPVAVTAPAVVGYLELLQSRDGFVPPYAVPYAEVRDQAVVVQIEADDLKKVTLNAKKAGKYPELANALRALACRGGWDPYLGMFATHATRHSEPRVFGGIEHGLDPREAALKLSLKAYHAKRNWVQILEQETEPPGLLLVWNGFIRARLRLDSGARHATHWVVTGYKAPHLVGEFERPLAPGGPSNEEGLGPIPAGASIDVQADPDDSYYEEWVYVIEMPYTEYERCVEQDQHIALRMAALVRQRTLEWLPRLAIGRRYGLLVPLLVRDWWKQAEIEGRAVADIPWPVWDSCLHEEGRDSGIPQLDRLAKSRVLRYQLLKKGPDRDGEAVRIESVDEWALNEVIWGRGRWPRNK